MIILLLESRTYPTISPGLNPAIFKGRIGPFFGTVLRCPINSRIHQIRVYFIIYIIDVQREINSGERDLAMLRLENKYVSKRFRIRLISSIFREVPSHPIPRDIFFLNILVSKDVVIVKMYSFFISCI